MSDSYSGATKLFHTLIEVEVQADWFLREMHIVNEYVTATKLVSQARDFDYVEPPTADEDAETRRLIESRRERGRLHYESAYTRFDAYHAAERNLRSAIDAARAVVGGVGSELDSPFAAPLDRTTTQIRYDLGRILSAYPSPVWIGPWPPNDVKVTQNVLEAKARIDTWIERLRALTRPAPAAPPAIPVHTLAPAAGAAALISQSNVGLVDAGGSASPNGERRGPAVQRGGLDPGDVLLLGWKAIALTLFSDGSRAAILRLQRLLRGMRHPVALIDGKPQVFKYEFLEWVREINRNARVAQAEAADREAERSRDRDGAAREMAERKGARLPDLKSHVEQRPAARGKARPAGSDKVE